MKCIGFVIIAFYLGAFFGMIVIGLLRKDNLEQEEKDKSRGSSR
tara:strand:- start:93 stop:224 length:132 start_codon:yes stop_codon:yes gene_type:complete